VHLADAFAHLAALADGSLAAITLVQVVEHLLPEGLLRLFRLAAQKLAPGGLVIAETLNPTCLLTLSNWFLLDPSHRTPLHPKTLQFLMEQAGLCQVQLRFLHPVPEGGRLAAPPPDEAQRGPEALSGWLQRHVEQLNQFLYGPQDYAAIAYKPEE